MTTPSGHASLSFRDGDWLNRRTLDWFTGYMGWPPDVVMAMTPARALGVFEGRLAFQLRDVLIDHLGGGLTGSTSAQMGPIIHPIPHPMTHRELMALAADHI